MHICPFLRRRNSPEWEGNAESLRASQHDARGRLSGEPWEPRVMSTNVGMASRRDGQRDWRWGDETADGTNSSFHDEDASDDDDPDRHGVGVAGDLSGEDDDEYDEEAGFSGRGRDDYGASLSISSAMAVLRTPSRVPPRAARAHLPSLPSPIFAPPRAWLRAL